MGTLVRREVWVRVAEVSKGLWSFEAEVRIDDYRGIRRSWLTDNINVRGDFVRAQRIDDDGHTVLVQPTGEGWTTQRVWVPRGSVADIVPSALGKDGK